MSRRSFDDPHGMSDKAKIGLLDNRCERNHKKRHRTTKRSSAARRKRIQRGKHKIAIFNARRKKFLLAVKRYWNNETDQYPRSA